MIVLDRVEGARAILEIGGEFVEIPASELPTDAKEGAVLVLTLGDAEARLAEARARLERLRAAGPQEDDIDLSG